MRLIDWMRREGITDHEFARLIGRCTPHAVKKWKYRERMPPPQRIAEIERVTRGAVRLSDWVAREAPS